jgi:uncharacterized membrane protein YjjP (DUF1212 family)
VKRPRPSRARQDTWRLFLNLSLTGFAGGLLLALIGAWLAATLTFAFGLLAALLRLAVSATRNRRADPENTSRIRLDS